MRKLDEDSRLIRASFGSREMYSQWFTSAFGLYTFFVIFLVPLRWQPPDDTWKIFAWYVGSLLLFDTFFTIYEINATSLFPVKFTKPEDRRAVQGWGTLLGILGLVLAFVITGMIVNQNRPESYRQGALVSFGSGFLPFALLLPGVYETKRLRAQYARNQRLIGEAAAAMVNASAMYVISYILDDPQNKSLPLIMGAMLMVASFVPMIFAVTQWQWVATLALFGASLGGQWFMDPLTMGDALDDAAVRTGKREQSIYCGYQTFIVRFGEALKAAVIALAHIATGFVEGNPPWPASRPRTPRAGGSRASASGSTRPSCPRCWCWR